MGTLLFSNSRRWSIHHPVKGRVRMSPRDGQVRRKQRLFRGPLLDCPLCSFIATA